MAVRPSSNLIGLSGALALGLVLLFPMQALAQPDPAGNEIAMDEAQASWQAAALERARRVHMETLPEDCSPDAAASTDMEQSHILWIGEESAAREALLVGFACNIGAYNVSTVYVLSDEHGVASPVWFPSPRFDIRYAGGDSEGEVEALEIAGSFESREVVNASYDADGRVMEEFNKWRGLGDAFSVARWGFRHGKFQLFYVAVDATYDGEANPQVLMDEDIW